MFMYTINLDSNFLPENIENPKLETIFITIKGDELLIDAKTRNLVFLTEDEIKWSGMEILEKHFLGTIENKACFVADLIEKSSVMNDTVLQNMMSLLGFIPDNLFGLCSRAIQLTRWYKTNQYCGKCGSKMHKHHTERAMECDNKDNLVYPKISPCVIVLVTRKDKILLAHNKNFPGKIFSTLAGFIEAGETVEEAISREILEEVNIRISNPVYFGSQSWPFPSQLMLGFHAEYLSGTVKPDGEEIDIAEWFNYQSLPQVPSPKISISGRLIESYISKLKEKDLPGFK
ncbi:MAG: NAD(+) diphosphatase [Gammaproteobacteria bacterium]|nr:NAD(+) diphosphatase [Gammaproteobacteria bacterium]